MANFIDRMVRAAKLEASLYEEVEADQTALGQAVGVVLLSSIAAGIGNYTYGGLGGLILGGIAALLGWYVWAFLTYVIGTKLLPEPGTHSSHGELLRTLGFASAPGLLRILGVVPGLTGAAFLVAAIWMLLATVIAVRQALDYASTVRAVGVCIIGWLVQILLLLPLFVLFGRGEP
jgi:hypothetical protein